MGFQLCGRRLIGRPGVMEVATRPLHVFSASLSLPECRGSLSSSDVVSNSIRKLRISIRRLSLCSCKKDILTKNVDRVVIRNAVGCWIRWLSGSRSFSARKAVGRSKLNEFEEVAEEEKELSRGALVWRAAKLPIYSVALVPLTVGTAAAYLQMHIIDPARYFVLLFSAVLIITWLNLSNDVYDFDTGADKNKNESVVNISGSRSGVLYAANIFLALGFIGILWGAMQAGDVRVAALLTGAILCGYVYQCPPFRLSYQGLGEPLCFASFGPFATSAFYFSQASKSKTGILPFNCMVMSVSLLVGVTTTLILFCSHFHQVDGDREVGKMSPLVRIGTERGSKVVKASVVALYSLLCIFAALKALPLTCALFSLLTLPIGKSVIDFVQENHDKKEKIFMAKYYCVRLHASFGAALALGLFAARTIHI